MCGYVWLLYRRPATVTFYTQTRVVLNAEKQRGARAVSKVCAPLGYRTYMYDLRKYKYLLVL
jgi:hypothetical protein